MRVIPIALQAHLDSGATTMAYIMRIEPRAPGYDPIGCTTLDRDIVYDDGRGLITYSATLGTTPSTLKSTDSMGVDNGENQILIPEGEMEVSEADLNAGAYDYADYWVRWVNYEDLTQGHATITRGTLGQVRVEDGLTFWAEITSLAKKYKTPIVKRSSRTCRATFGSQYPGTIGADVVERQPCLKDLSGLWVDATVSAVGLESSRTFTVSALAGDYVPGMVKWLTGDNAGRQYEVELVTGATVDLVFETMFPVKVGDTLQIRPDCTKWKDGTNGCKTHFGVDWVLHYRGEPDLKPEDSDAAITPGAGIGRGVA